MTPEELQTGDILPTVGETVAHMGKQYECTLVEWDREEDEITVSYRRRYADSSGEPLADPFKRGWLGVSTAVEFVDESHEVPLSELQKRLFGA